APTVAARRKSGSRSRWPSAAPGACSWIHPYHIAGFAARAAAPRLDPLEHVLERFQPVGLCGRLVPAQAVDARKAHGEPRLVAGRSLQSLESDFEHQARMGL